MDHATPNLPSRSFDATAEFYAALGFDIVYRAENWIILRRGVVTLEFFPHPGLDPAESWFSACLRLDDIDGFCDVIRAAGVPDRRTGFPRFHPPKMQGDMRMAALLDGDGSLLRIISN